MEETLLRRFASILNQTRQAALGIDQYIWTTAGDNRVRSSHASREGKTFSWDNGAIHPGSEPNCRCTAVPMLPDAPNVVLTQTPSGTATPPRPANPIGALLSVLSQLLANGSLTSDTRAAAEAQIAELYGLDLNTDRGRLAAELYLSVLNANRGGLIANPDEARIAAEAAALYALTYGETPPATAPTANAFINGAMDAYRQGNLTLQDDTFADGWTEVLPALTDNERRLGQLEGFTAEQMEAFNEGFAPADQNLLPNDTGGEAITAPGDDIVSTPIADVLLPQIVESRAGDFTTPNGNVVREHGRRGTGEEYMLELGHDAASVDAIFENPISVEPSSRRDNATGERLTIYFGANGNWALVNQSGEIIQLNDRLNRRQPLPE